MVAPGDLERVELERPEPVHHPQDRRRLGRERPGRRQEVALDEEAARGRAVDVVPGGHRAMVRETHPPGSSGRSIMGRPNSTESPNIPVNTNRRPTADAIEAVVEGYERLMQRLLASHAPEFAEVDITMTQAKVLYVVMAAGRLGCPSSPPASGSARRQRASSWTGSSSWACSAGTTTRTTAARSSSPRRPRPTSSSSGSASSTAPAARAPRPARRRRARRRRPVARHPSTAAIDRAAIDAAIHRPASHHAPGEAS